MGMEIIHGTTYNQWMPLNPGVTIYSGSLVCLDQSAIATDEGVICLPVPQGVNSLTNKDVPLGIVIDNNLRHKVFNTTYHKSYITDEGVTGPQVSTTEYVLHGSDVYPFGERRAMVKVARIFPDTVIKAPIRLGNNYTNITLLTSTTSASRVTITSSAACGFTPVQGQATIYFRTGANAGIYRTTDDTSDTVATWDVYTPNATAVGDTFVRVPVKPWGPSYVYLGDGTTCDFISGAASPASHYWCVYIIKLDLSEPGNEHAYFTFDPSCFQHNRA